MSLIVKSEKGCFITDEAIRIIPDGGDDLFYEVSYAGQTFRFKFSRDHQNSAFVEENKYILKGLIINKKFSNNKVYYNNDRLESIIKEANVPSSPKDKRDNLLLFLHSQQLYEGAIISPRLKYGGDLLIYKLYFKNHHEYYFYLKSLKEDSLITYLDTTSKQR